MRLLRWACFSLLLIAAISLSGESKNPADYPLRLHIFSLNQTTFFHNRYPDESQGEGRANLFQNGEPEGLDFKFDCSQKVKPSFGYETYPAKWKKANAELVVLFPVFGVSKAFFTCDLHTEVKGYAYLMHNGRLASEPAEEFRTWMVKHEYDPEHGKDMPTGLQSQPAPPAAP